MNTIEETVKQQLDGYNLDYDQRIVAEQVVAALVVRENQIAENLMTQARSAGIGDYVTREALESCGLQTRRLHGVVDDDADPDKARLAAAVADLELVASQQRESAARIDEQVAEAKRIFGI